MKIELSKPFAADSAADEYDVRQMKKALNRLGYYVPYEKTGVTGIPDAEIFTALKAFQQDQALPPTGIIKPGDETVAALNRALSVAPDGLYIWRSVGDDKVRSSHAALSGTVREWADSPDPGEDFNCRCWAEPVVENVQNLYPDAINPTLSPLDFIGGGLFAKNTLNLSTRLLIGRFRDGRWVRSATRSQIQHSFRRANQFGVKGNFNNKTLSQFRKAIEDHIKSPDVIIIKGTYRGKRAVHYYNPKTRLNVMRSEKGEFWSAWRLTDKQHFHMIKSGQIGGR
jgi:peptidoglycan hydrolase-like protein with peptidoglycan-binding domain